MPMKLAADEMAALRTKNGGDPDGAGARGREEVDEEVDEEEDEEVDEEEASRGATDP
jgi:hypothetical protein